MNASEIQTEDPECNVGERRVVPETFFCPISHSLMKDPVIVAETGQTYERNQIEQWLNDHSVDPLTNLELKNKLLIPNIALRNTIQDFNKKHRLANSLIGDINLSNIVVNDYPRNELKHNFKVSVVGGSNVGKTSLVRKISCDQFDEKVDLTVVLDIEVVVVRVGHSLVRLFFWDTAGEEKFDSMTFSHVRGSNAVLTVFDLSQPKQTLKSAKKYLLNAPMDDALLFLVGNKADLVEDGKKMQAAISMGHQFADNNAMIFFETSAKNARNIKELLLSITRSLLAINKNTGSREKSSEVVQLESGDSSKKCCRS